MSSFIVLHHVPLRHGTLCSSMFLLVCYGFLLLFTIFFLKNTEVHVFVRVVRKGLVALGMLLTQQIVLFGHGIKTNVIICG